MAANAEPSGHVPHQWFFRQGEVVLVLRPDDPRAFDGKDSVDDAALAPFLEILGDRVPLYVSRTDEEPDRLWVKRHPSLLVRRPTSDKGEPHEVRVLHTLRLAEWQTPEECDAIESSGNVVGGRPPIVAVARAVNILNEARQDIKGANFRLDSASPNWLAFPFQT